MTDQNALIRHWQDGAEWAGEALYNHHRESIFRLAYGLLGHFVEGLTAEAVAEATYSPS